MQVNHIFIVSDNDGREADDLVKAGLLEGSNRIHPGQGTRNRKFYFENFFLEIIWMFNESEVKSPETIDTGLWERINYRESGFSPFGICLENTGDSSDMFQDAYTYRPEYLPEGNSFKIIHNNQSPWLPWICLLPDLSDPQRYREPMQHEIGVKRLTGIRMAIPNHTIGNRTVEKILTENNIIVKYSSDPHISLEFDNTKRKKSIKFNSLRLSINY